MCECILVIDFSYKAIVLFVKESSFTYFCELNNISC